MTMESKGGDPAGIRHSFGIGLGRRSRGWSGSPDWAGSGPCLWLVSGLLLLLGLGVGNGRAALPYLLESWETDRGLPQNSVISIAQTPDGYLWLATYNGLARFDGVKFQTLKPLPTPLAGTSGSFTTLLSVDGQGRLCVVMRHRGGDNKAGDEDRVVRLEEDGWREYSQANGLRVRDIRALATDPTGRLLVVGEDRIDLLESSRFTSFPVPLPDSRDKIRFCRDSSSTLWGIQSNFFGRYLTNTWRPFPMEHEAGVAYVGLAANPDGSLWVVSRTAAWRVKDNRADAVYRWPTAPHRYDHFCADSEGNLWLSGRGLAVLSAEGRLEVFGLEDGLEQPALGSLFRDREGNMWLGTDGAGLVRVKRRAFRVFDRQSGLTHPIVDCVIPEAGDTLLVGSYGGGLFRFQNDRLTPVREYQAAGSMILSCLKDRQGNLWLSDFGTGVSVYAPDGSRRGLPEFVGGRRVHALYQDSQDTVWLGMESGLASIRGDTRAWYGTNEGVACVWVSAIAETRRRELWVGGEGGVFRLRTGAFERFVAPDGFCFRRVLAMHVDRQDALWIASEGQGLARLANDQWQRFDERAGLPPDTMLGGVITDDFGFLWLATDRHGILRAAVADLESYARGQTNQVRWLQFGKSDGLRSIECRTVMQPTVCAGPDGRLWFATLKGLAVVDPKTIRVNRQPPTMAIEAVRIDEHPVPWPLPPGGQPLRVPAGSKHIEIDYTGLSLTAPEKMRFQYRLKSGDAKWIDTGNERTARFVRLEPGDYVFEVRAQNNDGVWSESESQLALTVLPFYWQRFGFRAVVVLALMGIVATVSRQWLRQRLTHMQERLRQQEALAEERARSAALIQNASEVIVVLDARHLIVYESPSAARILGFPEGYLLGQNPVHLAHEEDQPALRQALERVSQEVGLEATVTFRFRHAKGHWMHLESLGTNLLAHPGVRGILVTTRDVSDRRQAEDQLRLLSLAVEQSPAIVLMTDPQGRISYVNQKFTEVTGYSRIEVLGRNPRFLKSGHTPAETYRALWESILAGRPWRGELQNRKKNGDLYWEAAVIWPLRDATGKTTHFLAEKEDITARKQAEETRARWEGQLRQAQKMEALGTLAGGIAHDFNNVLGAISGYAELARMDAGDNPAVVDSLEEVIKAARRARDLVSQILSFSRKTKHERKPIRLQMVLQECVKLLRSTTPASIALEAPMEPEPLMVLADPTQMHQIVMNLATNALHAMREGPGRLTMKLTATYVDPASGADPAGLAGGYYARLVVSDTGHGMDAETQKRIFEPFFTTKAQGEGTGLGLAVVHGIVAEHQGAIFVESQVGVGTTFQILLPLERGSSRPASEPEASFPKGQGERILYVDDEAPLCELARRFLQSAGYQVVIASDPLQALAICREEAGNIDLLFTDFNMPRMNGVELTQAILALRPDLPVVLTSGFLGVWNAQIAQIPNIREVAMKPLSFRDLATVVYQALHPSSPRSASVSARDSKPPSTTAADAVSSPAS